MPRTLESVFGAASGVKGFFEGQDIEEGRRRSRELYQSGKAGRERASEKAGLEHGKFKREFTEEEEARAAAEGAAAPATPGAAAPTPTDEPTPTLLSGATTGKPVAKQSAAAGEQPGAASDEEPSALWYRQAKAQSDYWTKKGRPERASKVLTDAINSQIAQQEARFKFEVLPRMEELRRKGLSAQELEADQQYVGLRQKQVDLDTTNAGLMWGHVLAGNKKAAIDSFNASGVTAPGVRVSDIGRSADGRTIYLLDERGQVVKDKTGHPLAYPKQLLDNLWKKSTTSMLTIKKGETLATAQKGPAGGLDITPIFKSEDPAEARQAGSARRTEDSQWATVINNARDDSHRYIKDALGLTPNALGQVMKPENQPVFEKAQPLVEAELQKFRASGKRMDQVTVTDIGKRALKQAREEYEREQSGAGPLGDNPNPNPNAPAGGGPTWRDVLK